MHDNRASSRCLGVNGLRFGKNNFDRIFLKDFCAIWVIPRPVYNRVEQQPCCTYSYVISTQTRWVWYGPTLVPWNITLWGEVFCSSAALFWLSQAEHHGGPRSNQRSSIGLYSNILQWEIVTQSSDVLDHHHAVAMESVFCCSTTIITVVSSSTTTHVAWILINNVHDLQVSLEGWGWCCWCWGNVGRGGHRICCGLTTIIHSVAPIIWHTWCTWVYPATQEIASNVSQVVIVRSLPCQPTPPFATMCQTTLHVVRHKITTMYTPRCWLCSVAVDLLHNHCKKFFTIVFKIVDFCRFCRFVHFIATHWESTNVWWTQWAHNTCGAVWVIGGFKVQLD